MQTSKNSTNVEQQHASFQHQNDRSNLTHQMGWNILVLVNIAFSCCLLAINCEQRWSNLLLSNPVLQLNFFLVIDCCGKTHNYMVIILSRHIRIQQFNSYSFSKIFCQIKMSYDPQIVWNVENSKKWWCCRLTMQLCKQRHWYAMMNQNNCYCTFFKLN